MPDAQRKDLVNTPSVAYERMALKWQLIHDLLGGTSVMRSVGQRWLPSEEKESLSNYQRRLWRSVLFEGLKSAIDKAVSRPFARPISVSQLPEELEFLEFDADGCGSALSQFARGVFEDMATYGKAHIFIDFSSLAENQDPEAPPATLAMEQAIGARASLVRVSPPALIGWIAGRGEGSSQPTLEQIRIVEKTTEQAPGSQWIDQEVTRIRVVTRDGYQLWREVQDGESNQKKFVLEQQGRISLGEIPFVTIYANKTGFMEADPPFEAVAWLNLAHWQSDSDQRNILRVSRFAILFARGLTKEEAEKGFKVGPFNTITSSSDKANLEYVEHQGTAISAGREDLKDLEARMEIFGMAPFVERSSQSTATGKAIDEAGALTKAQDWVRALEAGLTEAFSFASTWHRVELPEDFAVDVFSDFKVSASTADLDFLLRATQAGTLSLKTFLREIKRRGQLADSVNPDEELLQIQEEQNSMFGEGPPLDEDDDEPPEDE